MEQNDHPASARPKPRLTRAQYMRRKRLRLARNWAILLLVCAAVVALMTKGILWLLPKANALLADLHIGGRDKIDSMSKGTQEKMQLCLTMSRAARLYLLDEPLGGVDPAARDYILSTILHNYSEDAALMLSTHLIGDIEKVLDEVILLQDGKVLRQAAVDELREETGESVDAYFREVYKC